MHAQLSIGHCFDAWLISLVRETVRASARFPCAPGCPSGQRKQTVNLPAYAYGGSNPSPGTRTPPGGCNSQFKQRRRFAEASRRRAEMNLQPDVKHQAPLAQSVERFHGKEEVFGSNPEGGSASPPSAKRLEFGLTELRPRVGRTCRDRREYCRKAAKQQGGRYSHLERSTRRRSSVGESARLIIERSAVRVCPPLHEADTAYPRRMRSQRPMTKKKKEGNL